MGSTTPHQLHTLSYQKHVSLKDAYIFIRVVLSLLTLNIICNAINHVTCKNKLSFLINGNSQVINLRAYFSILINPNKPELYIQGSSMNIN